jgi:DUF4097 and DUF4098 domain-containing protein YvlB
MFVAKLKTALAVVVLLGVIALTASALGRPALARMLQGERPAGTPALQDKKEPEKPKQDKPKADSKEPKKDAPARRARAEETIVKSFKTKAAPQLIVQTFNGRVVVTTGAANTVEAKVVKSVQAASKEDAEKDLKNVDVQITQQGDTIRITAKQAQALPRINRGAAVEVKVPEGASLDLRNSNGRVTVRGPIGDVAAVSSNGPIEVKGGSKGTLNLKTKNGRITVEGGTGKIDLHTRNGRITIQAAKATVTAHTTNGSIRFTGSLADGKHSFDTTNGNLTLTLPAATQFHLDAQTSNGKVTTGFSPKQVKGKGKRHGRSRLQATIGDNPAITLKLRTSNGRIEVQPARQPPAKPR